MGGGGSNGANIIIIVVLEISRLINIAYLCNCIFKSLPKQINYFALCVDYIGTLVGGGGVLTCTYMCSFFQHWHRLIYVLILLHVGYNCVHFSALSATSSTQRISRTARRCSARDRIHSARLSRTGR